MLTVGTKAPSFALPNHTGDTIRVDPGDAHRPMALLFYPESGKYARSASYLPQ
jgi:peroxiredoxin